MDASSFTHKLKTFNPFQPVVAVGYMRRDRCLLPFATPKAKLKVTAEYKLLHADQRISSAWQIGCRLKIWEKIKGCFKSDSLCHTYWIGGGLVGEIYSYRLGQVLGLRKEIPKPTIMKVVQRWAKRWALGCEKFLLCPAWLLLSKTCPSLSPSQYLCLRCHQIRIVNLPSSRNSLVQMQVPA